MEKITESKLKISRIKDKEQTLFKQNIIKLMTWLFKKWIIEGRKINDNIIDNIENTQIENLNRNDDQNEINNRRKHEMRFKDEEAIYEFTIENLKNLDSIEIFKICNYYNLDTWIDNIISIHLPQTPLFVEIQSVIYGRKKNQERKKKLVTLDSNTLNNLFHKIETKDKRLIFCFLPQFIKINEIETIKFCVKLYPFLLPRNIKKLINLDYNSDLDLDFKLNLIKNEGNKENEDNQENQENEDNEENQDNEENEDNEEKNRQIQRNKIPIFWVEYLNQLKQSYPELFMKDNNLVTQWLFSLLNVGSPDLKLLFDTNNKPLVGAYIHKWKYKKLIDEIIINEGKAYNISPSQISKLINQNGYFIGQIWLLIQKNKYLKSLEILIQIGDFETILKIVEKCFDNSKNDDWQFLINKCALQTSKENQLNKSLIVKYMLKIIGPIRTMEILSKSKEFTSVLKPEVFNEIIENVETLTKQKKIMKKIIKTTSENLWSLKTRTLGPQIRRVKDLELQLKKLNDKKLNFNLSEIEIQQYSQIQNEIKNLMKGASFPTRNDFLSSIDNWGKVIQLGDGILCPVCNLPLSKSQKSDLIVFKSGEIYHKDCVNDDVSVCDFNTKLN